MCNITSMFSPSGPGTRSAAVTVSVSSTGSPYVFPLSGNGIDFAVVASAPSSATVSAGQSAQFTINLTTQGGPLNATVGFACLGLPPTRTCAFNPSSFVAGSTSGSTTLTIAPVAFGSLPAFLRPLLPFGVILSVALSLSFLAVVLAARIRRPMQEIPHRQWTGALLLGALVISAALYVLACSGSGSGSGTGGGSGGQPVTSTITVTASSGAVSRTTMVTLTVQ
jgi:hypothetical protein